ncbi:sensor histidine kinase [Paenibacillus ginsengarvi]|uniref:sensor histidine kinase n=1 Tax=Paenibacillus ginsengarvi TaxID=400777 RepID=UPI0018764949|nr:HAMP domain-containing sensor histidine kinase [Paenibacillus ginsengarvi]
MQDEEELPWYNTVVIEVMAGEERGTMLFVLLALWGIGTVLLLTDRRKSSIRWLSGVAFCGGSGALSAVIGDSLLPYATERNAAEGLLTLMEGVRKLSSLTQYYGLPYTFAMFALSYNPVHITPRLRKGMALVLLLPIAATLVAVQPIHPIPYRLTALWAIPYVVLASIWIIGKRESHSSLRLSDRLTSLAIVPAVLLCSVMNYVLPSLGFIEMWRYNIWIIAFAVLMFVVAIFGYGFLGIRFLIQTRRMDVSIRAVTSGTAVLNHAIKNDVGKTKLFGEKIRAYAERTNQPELAADIAVVLAATRHIQDMIARVQDQTQELALRPEWNDPKSMLESLCEQLAADSELVRIQLDVPDGTKLYCDRAQTTEMWNNVLSNAIEAMPGGGDITVKLYETKSSTIVEIRDSGPGMDRRLLKQVMEPFFTTKGDRRMNFGLGLSYCYQVMRKHGGGFDLYSQPGRGTTAVMRFPHKRRGGKGV